MNFKHIFSAIFKELPGNVLGEIAGNLLESVLGGTVVSYKQYKHYGSAVEKALTDFSELPHAETFLSEMAERLGAARKKRTPAPKTGRGGKDAVKLLASEALGDLDGQSLKAWSSELLEAARRGSHPELAGPFGEVLGVIEKSAAKYWQSLLDSRSDAMVRLIARTVEKQNAALREELVKEIRGRLFESANEAPMSAEKAFKGHALTCDNCGEPLAPESLRKAESGLFVCKCPACGVSLAFGSFTKEGADWEKKCGEMLGQTLRGLEELKEANEALRRDVHAEGEETRGAFEQGNRAVLDELSKFGQTAQEAAAAYRNKLYEVTHAQNIDEQEVLFYSRKLLALCPEDRLASFYIMAAENASDPQTVNDYLDGLDVKTCGRGLLCAVLDYLAEPLEPRMKVPLLMLVERAFQNKVFDRGDYERYETAIQNGKSFDPNETYDLFVAYSHADYEEARRLVDALEREELTCFWAFRDLPHGRGAGGQTYWNYLKRAMEQSGGFVFISTPNSRTRTCDVIERADKTVDNGEGELPYFGKRFPRAQKIRIEYRPPCDRNDAPSGTIKKILKGFFGDVSYCQTVEEVCEAASEYFYSHLFPAEPTQNEAPMPEEAPSESQIDSEKRAKEEVARILREAKAREPQEPAEEVVEKPAEAVVEKPAEAVVEEVVEEVAEEPALEEVVEEPEIIITEKGTSLSSFQIENGVLKKFIGKETKVFIPDGVTEIGEGAFINCSKITNITISNSVNTIGNSAFKECTSLTRITIPRSVTEIKASAFMGCALTSITIPNSVTKIGEGAFLGCGWLTSITIPNSVTEIGRGAFAACGSLVIILVEEGNPNYHSDGDCLIETASKTLVAGCNESKIPNDGSVKSIGFGAFSGLKRLTSIYIPNDVTFIGTQAFVGCANLTTITIPNSVISIGADMVYGCRALKTVYFEGTKEEWARIVMGEANEPLTKAVIFKYSGEREIIITENGTSLSSFQIENGILKKFIGKETEVFIPDGVTEIGQKAFINCSKLTYIAIPNSVNAIGNSAFKECTALTAITIPIGVTDIEASAFMGCTALMNIVIPNSVVSIGDSVFEICTALTGITIPNSVISIGKNAFRGCTSLTSIMIPNSVTKIGERAFLGCRRLTNVELPNSVTKIGSWSFYGCTALTSITIPNGVTKIGSWSFFGCTALTSITIPNSVTVIENGAFMGCDSLKTVYFCGTRAEWRKIENWGLNDALQKAEIRFSES